MERILKAVLWLLALLTFKTALALPVLNPKAEITKFHVNAKIQMRYAITNIETKVKNNHNEISDVHFSMYIPKEAFVANFSMVIKDKTYIAKVDTKENAKEIFESSTSNSGLVQSFNNAKFKNGKHVSLIFFLHNSKWFAKAELIYWKLLISRELLKTKILNISY